MADPTLTGNPIIQTQPLQMLLDPNLSQWILSPYDLLDTMRHTLRGEALIIEDDPDKGRKEYWIKQKDVPPMMNEHGINYLYNALLLSVNRNMTLSVVDEDEVNRVGLPIVQDVVEHMGRNLKEYDINPSMLPTLNRLAVTFIYLGLKRAWKGGERDFFGKTTSRQEVIQQQPDKGKGWFPFPFGGR